MRLMFAALAAMAAGMPDEPPRSDEPFEPWDPFAPPSPLPRGMPDPEHKLLVRPSAADRAALTKAAEKRARKQRRNLATKETP